MQFSIALHFVLFTMIIMLRKSKARQRGKVEQIDIMIQVINQCVQAYKLRRRGRHAWEIKKEELLGV